MSESCPSSTRAAVSPRLTGVDAFGLLDPLVVDVRRTGVTLTGVDPFGVVVPPVRGRSLSVAAPPIGVDAFAEFDPPDRRVVDGKVALDSSKAPPAVCVTQPTTVREWPCWRGDVGPEAACASRHNLPASTTTVTTTLKARARMVTSCGRNDSTVLQIEHISIVSLHHRHTSQGFCRHIL